MEKTPETTKPLHFCRGFVLYGAAPGVESKNKSLFSIQLSCDQVQFYLFDYPQFVLSSTFPGVAGDNTSIRPCPFMANLRVEDSFASRVGFRASSASLQMGL
jgi:hypothetical protein